MRFQNIFQKLFLSRVVSCHNLISAYEWPFEILSSLRTEGQFGYSKGRGTLRWSWVVTDETHGQKGLDLRKNILKINPNRIIYIEDMVQADYFL